MAALNWAALKHNRVSLVEQQSQSVNQRKPCPTEKGDKDAAQKQNFSGFPPVSVFLRVLLIKRSLHRDLLVWLFLQPVRH